MSPGRKNRDEESMEERSKKRFRGNNNGSPYSGFQKKMNNEEEDFEHNKNNKQHMPPASVMTRLILIMVWRKLIRNPNTYSSLLGVAWSLVSYKYSTSLPRKIKYFIYYTPIETLKGHLEQGAEL